MQRTIVTTVLALAVSGSGCTAIQQMAALRQVTFRFDRVANVVIAGVPVGAGADYSQIGVTGVARLAAAVAGGRVPIGFTAHVAAANPEANAVTARMVDMRWTLFVDDRRTLDGLVAGPVEIAPGRTADVPVAIEFDLMEFWQGGARDLFDVAAGIAGGGGAAKDVRLELVPTIETSLGPMRYPAPITIRR